MSRYILLSFLLLWQTNELLSNHVILSRVTDSVSFPGFATRKIRPISNVFNDIQLEPAILNLSGMVVNNSRGLAATMRAINKIDLELQPTRSSQGFLQMIPGLVTAELVYSTNKIELDISLENILGDVINETRFETKTTLTDDSEPVIELHYTAEAPVYVRCRGSYFF